MRRKPSEAWYVLAALILLCGMAGAAFGLGVNIRELVGTFSQPTPHRHQASAIVFHKGMAAGESQVIYQSVDDVQAPGFGGITTCKVTAPSGAPAPTVEASGAQDPAGTDAVRLFGATWAPRQRITPIVDGTYTFTCPNDTWIFGPDVASWGTQYVLRDWSRDFALWFVPGVILSGALAGFIAWRRRSTD